MSKSKKIEKTEKVEAEQPTELVQVTPKQSVIVDPKDLKQYIVHEKELRKIITDYIGSELKAGVDYGSISVKSRSGKEFKTKPTLFKPGSEKFCAIMHIRPTFRQDSETWQMSGEEPNLYCYVCELVNERGQIVGEGRGAARLMEKDNWTPNNAIKIAQKRAQIDAVIRTGQLSDFFTQDLEDMKFGNGNGNSASSKPVQTKPSLTPAQQAFQKINNKIQFVKKQEDADGLKEEIDANQDLTDKQMKYLKDLVNKQLQKVTGGTVEAEPF